MPQTLGIRRTLYAGLAAICLGLSKWQLCKADWLRSGAAFFDAKAKGSD